LATGSSGLGWFAVIGRSRVPSPPAMTTAFNGFAAPFPVSAIMCMHPVAGGIKDAPEWLARMPG
jgi:hypothetical protein